MCFRRIIELARGEVKITDYDFKLMSPGRTEPGVFGLRLNFSDGTKFSKALIWGKNKEEYLKRWHEVSDALTLRENDKDDN